MGKTYRNVSVEHAPVIDVTEASTVYFMVDGLTWSAFVDIARRAGPLVKPEILQCLETQEIQYRARYRNGSTVFASGGIPGFCPDTDYFSQEETA